MIQDDVRAFDTVMGAYGMPKETDDEKAARSAAIQDALKHGDRSADPLLPSGAGGHRSCR